MTHIPLTDPCVRCGKPASEHKVTHSPQGEPCSLCGLSVSNHSFTKAIYSPIESGRRVSPRIKTPKPVLYMGIDGEGKGRTDHKYVLLAACTEDNTRRYYVEDENGLSTEQCLDFILSLPHTAKLFSYSFNYDLTKILKDVNDAKIYKLLRPETRVRKNKSTDRLVPSPIRWKDYRINIQATKFTVTRKGVSRGVWDIFRFFGCKFVNALKDWKVGSEELWSRMTTMKDARSEFDVMDNKRIRQYCFEECQCMAELAHKLTSAHEKVGLKLTGYYGAGSSASAMLKKMGILEQIVPAPKPMTVAVASAFFGGRFENSVIGTVEGTVYDYDISSAYPYQLYFLPCLKHGRWEHTIDRNSMIKGRTALVRYKLHKPAHELCWAPFPFRMHDGSICFPAQSAGGWVWRDEYLMGEKLFPNVEFVEAWVLHSDCDCKPFADIAKYYLERLRIGKEGPGITIKLGVNSCYGKLAQSVGTAPFNSWIWAGLITSGCRAQLLEMASLVNNPASILMMATDGIKTLERIVTPVPRDTGTFNAINEFGKLANKPLGGWEEKIEESGVFLARPGIYFPLNPTSKQIKAIRGRGVGKSVVLEYWRDIIDSWNTFGASEPLRICNLTRFIGAKTAISRSGQNAACYTYTRSPAYGQWVTRPVQMSFNPLPKRECIMEDGFSLKVRQLPELRSIPYNRAIMSSEARELYAAMMELLEQPDGGDIIDYEEGA